MVSYQRFTSIAFDVAKSQGMRTSQKNSQDLISVVSDIWNENKKQLQAATIAEAEQIAEREIQVR